MNLRKQFLPSLFFFLYVLHLIESSYAQIPVSGTLPGNTTWGINESYLITSDLTVPVGVTLTILAGCTVQFDSNSCDLLVYGTLKVQGTSASPVRFVSKSAEHRWGGVLLEGSSGSSLEHAIFEGGGSGYFALNEQLQIKNCSPPVSHCTFRNSFGNAVRLIGSDSVFNSCIFQDSAADAVNMDAGSAPEFINITLSGNGFDGVRIRGGTLANDRTWKASALPFLIDSDLTVPVGMTLTIEPNTEVQFKDQSTDLIVHGILNAVGTASQPILFNSANRTPEAGRWGGIVLSGTEASASILQYCELNYGGSRYFSESGEAVLRISGSSPTIRDCRINFAKMDGINLYDSDVIIERCEITGCGENAIRMDGGCFPTFADNVATGNRYDVIAIRTGTLKQSGRWNRARLPYKLEADFTIPEGLHLAIDAGNTIRFQSSSTDLIVLGSLEALGTHEANILFTHLNNPNQGALGGIYFGPSVDNSKSQLTYCVFEYGGSNYFSASSGAMVYCDRSSPSFINCTFRNSASDGLWIRSADPVLSRLRFTSNRNYAIRILDNAFPDFSNLTASGNGKDSILITDSVWNKPGTWKNAGIPYILAHDVVLDTMAEVTIEPGVHIQFQEYSSDLIVRGNLKCEGTDANPITFNSWHSNPPPGRWGALVFENGATGSLRRIVMRHGGSGYFSAGGNSMLRLRQGSQVSVEQVSISNSGTSGIIVEATDTTIRNSLIENCKLSGIHALSLAEVSVTGCEISQCENGVFAQNSAVLRLTSSILSGNTNALANDSGDSGRIYFGDNQFTNNTRTGKVNFLTAASSLPGNRVNGDSGGLEVHWGDLASNGTFNPIPGGFYEFASSFYHTRHITGGGSLQIRPGTYLALRGNGRLIVQDNGYLGVIGRTEQPILIAAPPDVPSSTARSLMRGIHFQNSAKGVFKHAVLRNADSSGAIEALDSSTVTVEQCRFDYNARALYLRDSVKMLAEYSQFTNNGSALETDNLIGSAVLRFCRITGNNSGVINSRSAVDIDATLNWWGDAGGPSGQGPGTGDSITNFVLYAPFFTSAGQVPGQPLEPIPVEINTPYTQEVSRYGLVLYRVAVEQGRNFLCMLTQGNPGSRYGIYANRNSQPSVAQAEYSVLGSGLRGTHELLIADATGGQYDVLVFADHLANEPETYQIQFSYVNEYVVSLSPKQGGNRGVVTLNLSGSQFHSGTEIRLLRNTVERSPISVLSPKSDRLHASFSLMGMVPGSYDLEVSWPHGGAKQTFSQAFHVVPGVGARLEADLLLPEVVRPNRLYTMLVRYRNAGDADLLAPLLTIRSLHGAPMSLTADGPFNTEPLKILEVFQEGPAGILPPGASGEIPIYFQGIFDFNIGFALDSIKDPAGEVDWRNSGKWHDYAGKVGTTWSDHQTALASLATSLWQKGALVYDAAALEGRILSEIRERPLSEAHGRVLDDQTGHPQAGVAVLFTEIGQPADEARVVEAMTDKNGEFIARGLTGSEYMIEVMGYPGVLPEMITLDDGEVLVQLELVVGYGGAVQGQVVDGERREPMANVSITLINEAQGKARVVMTDAGGNYRLPALDSGLYRIQAESSGYATRQYAGLQIWYGQVLRNVDFVLHPERTLTGKISEGNTSEGIEGAVVIAQREDGLRFTTVTTGDGSYTMEKLSTGHYTVICQAMGYRPSGEVRVNIKSDGANSLDFILAPGAVQPVQVVTADTASVIPEALVVCRNLQTGDILTEFTQPNGTVTFSGVREGIHYIYASAKSRAMVGKLIQVTSGTMPMVRVELPRTRSLAGTVMNSLGNIPAEESFVVIENARGTTLASGLTLHGVYEFEHLPVGSLSVTAFNPDLSYSVMTVSSEATTANLTPASGGIQGTIGSGGETISDAIVILYPVGDGADNLHPRFARSDTNGAFRMDSVLSGDYLLTSLAEGYGRGSQPVSIGNQMETWELELPKEVIAGGRVLSTLAGSGILPVPNAIIWLTSMDSPQGDPGIAAMTNEQGKYSLENLTAGSYRVRAIAPGHVMLSTSPITLISSGDHSDIDLYLTAEGTLVTGAVMDQTDGLPLVGAEIAILIEGMEIGRYSVDHQGYYWSDPLAAGDYDVEIRFGGHLLQTTLSVTAGIANQTADFTVALEPMAGIGIFDRLNLKPGMVASAKPVNLQGWFSTRDVPRDPREARLRSIDWDFYSSQGDCQPEAMGVQAELDSALFAYWNAQDALENASWSAWRENAAVVTQSFVLAGKIAEVVLSFKSASVQALAALSDARETFKNVNSIIGDINLVYGMIKDVATGIHAERDWDYYMSQLQLIDKTVGKVLDVVQEKKLWGEFGRLAAPIYKLKDIVLELWNLYEEYNQAAQTINATEDSYIQALFQYQLRISRAWAEYLKFLDCQNTNEDPPFPSPDGNPVASGSSLGMRSFDPNEKTGPGGFEAEINPNDKIVYTIFFENVPDASAAAQMVLVEDYLDEDKLNWDTFELLEVAFGDRNIPIPAGRRDYATTVVFDEKYEVRIEAQLNRFSGKASWELSLIDPLTGTLPLDGEVGFLPPNDEEGSGEGHVMFSISPVAGLTPGTEIRNDARIVFDANEAIDTNQTVHTIWTPVPDQPVNITPAEGAIVQLLPILTASQYSHPTGSAHTGSQFEIRSFELGGVIWDSTDSTSAIATTEIGVPTGILQAGTKYLWKVRYASEPVGTTEKWSPWSEATWFMTEREIDPEFPDFNDDGLINALDLLTILNNWHTSGPGDLDSSGRVDSLDLMLFIKHWNKTSE